MDIEPGDIVRDTTPRPVEGIQGRYVAAIPDAWRIFYAFGGATMATALRAADDALDRDDLSLRTADATFCQAVPCGPVALQVEVLRQGRSAAQALVRLWSIGSEADAAGPVGNDLVVTAVFGAAQDSPYRFVGARFPSEVPGPDQSVPRADLDDGPFARIPYHQQTELRLPDPERRRPDAPPGDPRASTWFRFRVPPLRADGTWEPAALALPGDILGTAVHAGTGGAVGPFLVISLQISLHVLGETRADWLLQHTTAHRAGDGYASGTAELWEPEGRLVAVATQCAKLQPIEAG